MTSNSDDYETSAEVLYLDRAAGDGIGDDFWDWGPPIDLKSRFREQPYPIDALPEDMAAAVSDFTDYGKMPLGLVGSSAMASLSAAGQHLADVARDDTLIGPISLNLMPIAMSGERKSTADKFLGKAIKEHALCLTESLKEPNREAKALHSAWESKVSGVKSAIKRVIANGQTTNKDGKPKGRSLEQLEKELIELELNEPSKPVDPSFIHEESTTEGLAWKIATGGVSHTLWSDEGGIVIGGLGMRKDSITGFFSLQNRLWDGQPYTQDRKIAATVEIRDVRYTANMMVQPAILDVLLKSGPARGIGFLARYLISWPRSTMGSRKYTSPTELLAVDSFNSRLAEMLRIEPNIQDCRFSPPVLRFSPTAQEGWIRHHDEVESKLAEHGEYYDVRDFASKVAENTARVACLFHLFKYGPEGNIDSESLYGAAKIVLWHLSEALRVFSEYAESEVVMHAKKLSEWLSTSPKVQKSDSGDYYEIDRRIIQQYGPNPLRKKSSLTLVLDYLVEHDHCRIMKKKGVSLVLVHKILREGQ